MACCEGLCRPQVQTETKEREYSELPRPYVQEDQHWATLREAPKKGTQKIRLWKIRNARDHKTIAFQCSSAKRSPLGAVPNWEGAGDKGLLTGDTAWSWRRPAISIRTTAFEKPGWNNCSGRVLVEPFRAPVQPCVMKNARSTANERRIVAKKRIQLLKKAQRHVKRKGMNKEIPAVREE